MKPMQIIQVINQLPISSASDAYTEKTDTAIADMAEKLSPMFIEKGLQISSGSSSPSGNKSVARIYLEKVGNPSHNVKHKNCQIIKIYEYQTKNAGWFTPVSQLNIRSLCRRILEDVKKYE